jgi:hypothetical protein
MYDYADELDANSAEWLKWLIRHFREAFQQWTRKHHTRNYLERLKSEPRLTRLTLCVYLHVAWDLPRVVADSFSEEVSAPFKQLSVDAARQIFRNTAGIFDKVMADCLDQQDVFGGWAVLSRLMRLMPRKYREAAPWLLASPLKQCREEAFETAQRLALSSDRPTDEDALWDNIDADAERAIGSGRPWDVFRGPYRMLSFSLGSVIGALFFLLLVAMLVAYLGRSVLQVLRFRSIVLHRARAEKERAYAPPTEEVLDFSGDGQIQLEIQTSPDKKPERPLVARFD